MSRNTSAMLAVTGLWILTAGCAGSTKPEVNWRGSMGSYFENTSVKPGEPPRRFWDTADEELLLRRMGYADTVAVGTIRLVSGYEHRGTGQLALAFRTREVLYGSIDQDKDTDGELRLRLDPSAADYSLARKIQKQLPGTHYLLFLKRRPRRDGKHDLRWAFYRPRRKLMAEVRARYRWLKKAGDRARAHKQREQELDDVSIGELLETPETREAPRSSPDASSPRGETTSVDEPGFLGQEP